MDPPSDGSSKWLAYEQDHINSFRKHVIVVGLEPLPEWYPEEETLRMLHGDNWNYD